MGQGRGDKTRRSREAEARAPWEGHRTLDGVEALVPEAGEELGRAWPSSEGAAGAQEKQTEVRGLAGLFLSRLLCLCTNLRLFKTATVATFLLHSKSYTIGFPPPP